MTLNLSETIFRAYDIRGLVGTELNEKVVYHIGRAIASTWQDEALDNILVGYDTRASSPSFSQSLIRGIVDTGMHAIDVGCVTSPMIYYAALKANTPALMVTASHNPDSYNGIKMVVGDTHMSSEDIKALYGKIIKQDYHKGVGSQSSKDIQTDYVAALLEHFDFSYDYPVIIDYSNACSALSFPGIIKKIANHVITLNTDVSQGFVAHDPDPSVAKNYAELLVQAKKHQAIGIMFDGDSDRIGIVSPKGNIIWPDHLMMLYIEDILANHPKQTVLYDVKTTMHLAKCIEDHGGVPLMWKTGHTHIRAKLKALNGVFAGEMSGHIFFSDRWYGYDDGFYAALRLLELFANNPSLIDEKVASYPKSLLTPEIKVAVDDRKKFHIVEQLQSADFAHAVSINRIDGLRVSYECGWFLIRASNTSPALTVRLEALDEETMRQLQSKVSGYLAAHDLKINYPEIP